MSSAGRLIVLQLGGYKSFLSSANIPVLNVEEFLELHQVFGENPQAADEHRD